MTVPLCSTFAGFGLLCFGLRVMTVIVVFGLDYDGPPSGEHATMHAELVRLEEEPAKDGNDSEIMAIGKVHDRRCGSHAC
jgi:hypothetical protein